MNKNNSLLPVNEALGIKLVKHYIEHYGPICSISSPWDMPQGISSEAKFQLTVTPPIYWDVKSDLDDTYYIMCCVYHSRDITHHHDFTGWVWVVKNHDEIFNRPFAIITRSHFKLIMSTVDIVPYIQEDTHAIIPFHNRQVSKIRADNSVWAPHFWVSDSCNLGSPHFRLRWKIIADMIGPNATLPDQWDDEHIYNITQHYPSEWEKIKEKYGIESSRGLIFHRPDLVFSLLSPDIGFRNV